MILIILHFNIILLLLYIDEIEPEPYEMGEHLIQASGKFVIIDGLLKYIKKNNHKVLVYKINK